METKTNDGRRCRRCGGELIDSTPEGLCLCCMLKDALPQKDADADNPEQSSQEHAGAWIGRYRLMEKLGEGGFGEVWVAEQREPVRRRVALKIIKLGMDTKQVVARFEAERQALALMDHPNIARVLDAGATETGRPYFVMELVKGIPITQYADLEHLSTNDRLKLFTGVCHAIRHAHQKGVIHRDIKPTNILVTLHDGMPVPKVIDFGIAKATQAELTEKTIYTQYSQFIGTPAYMSPEQAEMSGLDIDTRSDIYSLGVLLYELLTGTTPFDTKELISSGLDEMRKIIRERDPVRPSTRVNQALRMAHLRHRDHSPLNDHAAAIDRDLDSIVMKCLEKDRTRRYETANGLAMDLKRHSNKEPIVARPPSTGYRLHKAWQRNKVIFTAGAMVLIALVGGATVSLWQGSMANKARDAEARQRLAAEAATRLAETRQGQMHRRAYAADMNLAHQAIRNNNLGRALGLINRYRPQPGQPDLRGWEWRYLWALCQSDAEFQLCSFPGPDPIVSVDLSPDGKWAAFGGLEKTGVRIWDIAGRRELTKLAVGEEFCHVAFSPVGRLLAYSSTRLLRLWDYDANQLVAQADTSEPIVSLGFSGNGERLISFSQSDAITIWDANDLHRLKSRQIPVGHAWLGSPFAFSPDLSVAVRVEGYNSIVAVDLDTGTEHWRVTSDEGFSHALAISPDGTLLVTGFGIADGNIYVYNMATGDQVGILSGHRAWISSLVFWPDGTKLASASADQTIRIWDMRTLKTLRVLQGHELEVWSLALSPDAEQLVSGGKDGSAFVWDANRDPEEQNHWRLPGRHDAWTFSSDGNGLVTVADNTSKVFKLTGPRYSKTEVVSEIGRDDPTFSQGSIYEFSPSGSLLSVLSTNGTVSVWDVARRRQLQTFPTEVKATCPATFSADPSKIWLKKLLPESSVGKWVFDLSEWDMKTGEPIRSIPDVLAPFQIVPDKWVFGRSSSNLGMLHDLASGETFYPMMFRGRMANLFGRPSFSPQGRLLAVPHDAGVLTIWDTADLRSRPKPEPVRMLGGILMSFNSCGFSPDGTRLFGCSHGQEAIKIWDTSTFHELLTLAADSKNFEPPRFSPDGRDLVAKAVDEIFVWRAASWEEIEAAGPPNIDSAREF